MKKTMIFLLLPVFTLLLGASGFKPVGNQGFAVVELFTSEGCSSCPPADEAVAALSKKYPSGVYVLCFHVDYWDHLGWKDPFSSAGYTQRQRSYGDQFRLSSVYTPQAVVNGKTEFVGSDAGKLSASIERELSQTTNLPMEASAKSSNGKTVEVSYTIKKSPKSMVQAALIQLHASTAVKKGENAGRQLQHSDIVRDLKTSQNGSGALTLDLPAGVSANDCRIILLVQDKGDLHIEGAKALVIH